MIAVIFEVFPADGRKDDYLEHAARLRFVIHSSFAGNKNVQLPLSHPANGFLESRQRASRKIAAFCSLHLSVAY